jgi:hypothetical protein
LVSQPIKPPQYEARKGQQEVPRRSPPTLSAFEYLFDQAQLVAVRVRDGGQALAALRWSAGRPKKDSNHPQAESNSATGSTASTVVTGTAATSSSRGHPDWAAFT